MISIHVLYCYMGPWIIIFAIQIFQPLFQLQYFVTLRSWKVAYLTA